MWLFDGNMNGEKERPIVWIEHPNRL